MDNLKMFEKLVKGLPDYQQKNIPEKIRLLCNSRSEHTVMAKAILLGTYLVLNDEITLTGYIDNGTTDHPCSKIRNDHTGKMII